MPVYKIADKRMAKRRKEEEEKAELAETLKMLENVSEGELEAALEVDADEEEGESDEEQGESDEEDEEDEGEDGDDAESIGTMDSEDGSLLCVYAACLSDNRFKR